MGYEIEVQLKSTKRKTSNAFIKICRGPGFSIWCGFGVDTKSWEKVTILFTDQNDSFSRAIVDKKRISLLM